MSYEQRYCDAKCDLK